MCDSIAGAMTTEVVAFAVAGRLSVQEYRQQRADLRMTYGDTQDTAKGLASQALAHLLYRSGWTQEELAHEEGKSRMWVDYQSRFGRFLNFGTAVPIPKTFTEGSFRSRWERTDPSEKNERIRFAAVLRLMEEETRVAKSNQKHPEIAAAIKAHCATGEFFKFTTVVARVQGVVETATADDVRGVLHGMVARGAHNVFCEKKGGDVYRIVIGGNQKVNLQVLKQELGPILKRLKAEGRKNMATMSPPTVANLAFEIEKVLERMTHEHRAHTDDAEE
jgi:hypothetical protein